ncbi:MAG TPA: hypothetical protein LFW14_06485 [Rickettsia endosymbiont of Degeeriella rufa]|nr:hypothetical protein [Rickettsia endosymbiont of Degeeriella rufa]
MNKRIGKYIIQKVSGKSYKAYIPPELPPKPPIDLVKLYTHLEKATLALAELNITCKSIPNTYLFICMSARKHCSQAKLKVHKALFQT